MFIKPSILIIAAVILLLVAIFIAGCAKHRFHSATPEEKAEWVVKKISSELDLEDAQKAKLETIKTDILARHREFGSAKSDIWNEVSSQIQSESVDQQKLNTLFSEKENQFKEMRVFMVAKFAEFHEILTQEQRTQLLEKMSKLKKRWHH
jgi:Spy/CpxP family protein refolding chaperone